MEGMRLCPIWGLGSHILGAWVSLSGEGVGGEQW
jgi:hypothetical protein